ncbi:MAG: hypothetical protein HON90_03360 [Halobacteriovoraceae bacterium]|jgi:hypothetical protein|nr:hypothetical protein [Halobacteriovoraceae bacterium]
MSTEAKIKIINTDTDEILFQFDMDQADMAFSRASELEQMGLSISVKTPTISESLCNSLGLNIDQKMEYQESVLAEIEDHDGSCCASTSIDKPNLS